MGIARRRSGIFQMVRLKKKKKPKAHGTILSGWYEGKLCPLRRIDDGLG